MALRVPCNQDAVIEDISPSADSSVVASQRKNHARNSNVVRILFIYFIYNYQFDILQEKNIFLMSCLADICLPKIKIMITLK